MMRRLTNIQREQMSSFPGKSPAWFTVAVGATLVATGETWRILRHYDWPVWLFWLLLAVMSHISRYSPMSRA